MTHSPGRSVKSGVSGISRTSISVTLPSTNSPEPREHVPVIKRKISPERPFSVQGDRLHHDGGIPETNCTSDAKLQGSPSKLMLNKDQLQRLLAARVIERVWLAYRDRQMFRLLKHAVCAAEHAMSHQILRKVCPKEAEFLKDKSIQTKVRFRFGGREFPPQVLFKVYTCTNGKGVNYMSGKKMIQPASEAARDACDQMGPRIFYDQMIQDMLQRQQRAVTDEVDVTTLKDYMQYQQNSFGTAKYQWMHLLGQYLSILDELPAHMGGKENSWRKLTLEALPRQTIFYDVVDYLYHHRMTPRLAEELPVLVTRPFTQEMQLQHIRIVSRLRSPLVAPHPSPKPLSRPLSGGTSKLSSRRSRQARDRASKMKKMYDSQKEEVVQEQSAPQVDQAEEGAEFDGEDAEDWEEEASKLYEWTQELSLEDLVVTPRLTTAAQQEMYLFS